MSLQMQELAKKKANWSRLFAERPKFFRVIAD
jgi:hypothetical protein